MTRPVKETAERGGAVGGVPGEVYLCQVDDRISCGACCGLYNVADASRKGLTAMLARRTERFHRVPRTPDDLVAFGEEMSRLQAGNRPYPGFHHCPYVGLIGGRRDRAGCLLHPLGEGNGGIDYRGLSYYGGMACRDYFCPSCRRLPANWKRLIRASAGDWYRHGLIVTEVDLLTAFFSEVEHRLGNPLQDEALSTAPGLIRALSDFIDLRIEWPYRPPEVPVANYFFENSRYQRPPVWYHTLESGPSRYDVLLRELGTAFSGPRDCTRAEDLLDRHIEAVVEGAWRWLALSRPSTTDQRKGKESLP
jgi:hypothetical protein